MQSRGSTHSAADPPGVIRHCPATENTACALCSYATQNQRLDLQEQTKLNLEAEEQAQLQERQASHSQASSGPHFICETFFLTARALHLGYVKIIADIHSTSQACPMAACLVPSCASMSCLVDGGSASSPLAN